MKIFILVLLTFLFSFSISGQQNANQKTTATDFSATTLDGKPINTADLRGKIIVLNLWFINCPNCVQEIKLLNQVVEEYKNNKDVVFLALATNKPTDLEKFLKKNPFAYQIIPSAGTIILNNFGTPDKNGKIYIPFPTHLVINKDGKTLLRAEGLKGVEAVKAELKKQFSAK